MKIKPAIITLIIISSAGIAGCNDNKTTKPIVKTVIEKGLDSLVSQTLLSFSDTNCVFGGVLISSGIDQNDDGTLDDTEVNERNFACNENEESILDPSLIAQGREIFRYDTFGDEQLWTDTLHINEVIESAVSPLTALSVGLKVDSTKLPEGILDVVDLNDPATTLALIGLNAVVGIQGTIESIDGINRLTRVGITCALCHSNVDDSVIPGIGKRLDGHPNTDLNPGFILSLSPALQDADSQAVLTSWGPGKYDAYWNQDGLNDPTVIPPAYGFNGINTATFTGEGDISYWNAYVAVTQMGGHGNFIDQELGLDIQVVDDQVTSKLPALREYQLSLRAPSPPVDSFDAVAAGRGKIVFEGQGQCASCHAGNKFTDANYTLHDPIETGTDATLASRSKTGQYRTTPLAGAWQRAPYFHDGSAQTLEDVINHYDNYLALNLTIDQQTDLAEYLKSL